MIIWYINREYTDDVRRSYCKHSSFGPVTDVFYRMDVATSCNLFEPDKATDKHAPRALTGVTDECSKTCLPTKGFRQMCRRGFISLRPPRADAMTGAYKNGTAETIL